MLQIKMNEKGIAIKGITTARQIREKGLIKASLFDEETFPDDDFENSRSAM